MTPGAKLCLKARPTQAQLADRLRPVGGAWPDGLELYLNADDIADRATMDAIVARLQRQALPAGFALLIEGPIGSLDGQDFDVTRESTADREVVARLAELAGRLGARAVNIHAIAPSGDVGRLTPECRTALLRRAVPFLRYFVAVTRAAGALPTVENAPPVMRMRRGDYVFTPIGMASEDLRWLVGEVPGLGTLVDTSHAGLYLNARRFARNPAGVGDVPPSASWLPALLGYLRQLPEEAADLPGYARSLEARLGNAQVSNATGLLGEGQPYGEGDFDLDPVIRWLGGATEHIVTETLEPDPDDARFMRDALRHMRGALA